MNALVFPVNFRGVDVSIRWQYIHPIISPVASVAGREAGSSESASAFSGSAA